MALPDVDQLNLETQHRLRRDRSLALRAIRQPPRDEERALLSLLHRNEGFVPALDHLPGAHAKGVRGAAVARAVKLGAVHQVSVIVNDDLRPERRNGALAGL